MTSKYFLSLLLAFSVSLCAASAQASPEDNSVKWVGALRNVHHGIDYSGKIDLNTLADLKHLYAVGPEEGLKGEITVWDSKPLLAEINKGRIVVTNDFNRKACFLVYGQVSDWQELPVQSDASEKSVSEQVKSVARSHGITTDKPFVFLIKGKAKNVRLHVLNKVDDIPPDGTSEQHEKAKVRFTISDQPVEILGFYSEHHQGVFTHHDSFVHLHVRTPDNKISGHVESLELEPGSILLLPAAVPRVL